MLARPLLALTLLASAPAAQNLLTWDDWTPWTGYLGRILALSITPTNISFSPSGNGSVASSLHVGIEQRVTIPADGFYQLEFYGYAEQNINGNLRGFWSIEGHKLPIAPYSGPDRTYAWTIWLTKGVRVLTFDTNCTRSAPTEFWTMQQPTLRPVLHSTPSPFTIGRWILSLL